MKNKNNTCIDFLMRSFSLAKVLYLGDKGLKMAFVRLELAWYMVLAVVIFLLCLFFREGARRKFMVANLTLRAS